MDAFKNPLLELFLNAVNAHHLIYVIFVIIIDIFK